MMILCQGSSHSDKEVDPNTPEKIPRTPSERKRKRKNEDVVGVPPVGGKGVRTVSTDKKIDYFNKHSGNSPIRHGGAKSPSPQQSYVMVGPFMILFLKKFVVIPPKIKIRTAVVNFGHFWNRLLKFSNEILISICLYSIFIMFFWTLVIYFLMYWKK